jgi:hypothetical protein
MSGACPHVTGILYGASATCPMLGCLRIDVLCGGRSADRGGPGLDRLLARVRLRMGNRRKKECRTSLVAGMRDNESNSRSQ